MNNRTNRIEIAIHILVWIVLLYLPVALSTGSNQAFQDIFIHVWLQLSFFGIIFYVNYLWVADRFLFGPRSNKWLYILINLLLVASLISLKYSIFQAVMGERPPNPKAPPRRLIWYMDFLMDLIPIAFCIAIKSGKKLMHVEVYRAEAENARLESELQHLKYQLQPHFFFNALNNIYSLIEVDPQKAQQTVHSLSKLMRHLLKTSEEKLVSLQDEVDFLNKYIHLMRLRLTDKVHVHISFPANLPDVEIAPFLFISLVENAFKHGVSATQESEILFSLKIMDNHIEFRAINTCFPKSESDFSGSGIGLSNLKKRLKLLYPQRFNLDTRLESGYFQVSLSLTIIYKK